MLPLRSLHSSDNIQDVTKLLRQTHTGFEQTEQLNKCGRIPDSSPHPAWQSIILSTQDFPEMPESHVGGLVHRNPVYFHSCILVVPYKGPATVQEPLQRLRISVIDHSAQLQMDDAQIYSTIYSWRGATWFCDLLQKEGCWWVYLEPSSCSLNPERQSTSSSPKVASCWLWCHAATLQFVISQEKQFRWGQQCESSEQVVTKAFPAAC